MRKSSWQGGPAPIEGPAIESGGIDRRDFLRALVAAGAGSLVASVLGSPRAARAASLDVFPDGVKSGDPLPDGCVLWTRVPAPADGSFVPVLWLVAEDPGMKRVVRGGIAAATADVGHSVKLRVAGLRPDRWYHYAFNAQGESSPIGRLRTAPAPDTLPDRLRYAFASCQQRNDSYYVAHRAIANDGVDFLMHLGDYIYVSDFGDLTLADYRRRWRIFHSNPLLQELQAKVPLVAMWDDGEFYNGIDKTGDPVRLAAAKQAWFEHQPHFAGPGFRSYRAFSWGRLADVFMIDVRSYRDPEVPPNVFGQVSILDGQDAARAGGAAMFDPARSTLGIEQRRWLERGLVASRAAWRFIGNPYNFNPWKLQDRAQDPSRPGNEGVYVSNEAWDDFQYERRQLLEILRDRRIGNVVFTSGHTHFYIASELQVDFDDPASPTLAFDFVTGSQTADPDPRTLASIEVLRLIETGFLRENQPYMRDINLVDQGYAVVDATPEETVVEFRVIDTFDPDAEARTASRYRILPGADKMEVERLEG
jgi:alkaline phosphatase D